jgi:hypothetical protein
VDSGFRLWAFVMEVRWLRYEPDLGTSKITEVTRRVSSPWGFLLGPSSWKPWLQKGVGQLNGKWERAATRKGRPPALASPFPFVSQRIYAQISR